MGAQQSLEVGYACVSGDISEVDRKQFVTKTFLQKQSARQNGKKAAFNIHVYCAHNAHRSKTPRWVNADRTKRVSQNQTSMGQMDTCSISPCSVQGSHMLPPQAKTVVFT